MNINNNFSKAFGTFFIFLFFTTSFAQNNVGIGTTAPTALLSVNGTANNSTGAWGVFSDARVKTVDSDFTDGLEVIKQLHPVKFNYNSTAPFKANGEQIGVIAQELEKIAPYMVSKKEVNEYKDLREVSNQAYVFLLINAVKELSRQNEAQQKITERQQSAIQNLQTENKSLQSENKVFKSDIEKIKLQLGMEAKK